MIILRSVLLVRNLTFFSKKLQIWTQNNAFCSYSYRACLVRLPDGQYSDDSDVGDELGPLY